MADVGRHAAQPAGCRTLFAIEEKSQCLCLGKVFITRAATMGLEKLNAARGNIRFGISPFERFKAGIG